MTTARDLVTFALKEAQVVGVGQTPLAEDINDGFTLLKRMMAQWQKRRWLIPMLIDVSADGNGLISNPIGVGGHYNTPRPDKIQSAYFTQRNNSGLPVSYPLLPIFSYEDYAKVAIKTLNSFPSAFFYDGAFPLGNVFIYPIPSDSYTIHLIVKGGLNFPTDIDQTLVLPDEYEEAIHYNLAMRICSAYGTQVQPSTGGLAKVSLNTIKNANAQVPTLEMPFGIRGGYGSDFGGGGSTTNVTNPTPVLVTSGNYNVGPLDQLIFVNYASPVTINLPPLSTRNHITLVIKDTSGNASINNISIIPYAGDGLIDGLSPYLINTDYGAINLAPDTGGWAVIT